MHDLYSTPFSSNHGDELGFSFLRKSNDGRISFFGERTHQGKKTTAETSSFNQQHLEQVKKPLHEFCTGSRYVGKWNKLGIAGHGIYRYPHGVIYEGNFNVCGEFDGAGTLIYPNGQKLEGIWERGRLKDSSYMFSCGEVLSDNFEYCQMPDRRFHVEVEQDFGPAGQEYLTNHQPVKKIPEGCYDTVDGFYNPKTHCIEVTESPSRTSTDGTDPKPFTHVHGLTDEQREAYTNITLNADRKYRRKKSDEVQIMDKHVKEIPSRGRIKWIKHHCRKPWDELTGYRPDLFEDWTVGRKHYKYSREFHNTPQIPKPNYNVTIQEPTDFVSFIKKPWEVTEKRFSIHTTRSSITPRSTNKKDLFAIPGAIRHKRLTLVQ